MYTTLWPNQKRHRIRRLALLTSKQDIQGNQGKLTFSELHASVAHNAIPILRQLKKSQRASLQKCSRSPLEMPTIVIDEGNAPPPATRGTSLRAPSHSQDARGAQRTHRAPCPRKRLIHPPGSQCHIVVIHLSRHNMWTSSMKAIGIRCWPDRTMRSLAALRKGRKGAVRACERPLTLSGQSGPARRPTHITAPLVPAGTSTCRRKRPGSTFCGYAQVFLRPALRPRPAHCTLMSGCTRWHCLPSARAHI